MKKCIVLIFLCLISCGRDDRNNPYDQDGTNHVAPYKPSNLIPAAGAVNQSINARLRWTGGGPVDGDTVKYDVYLGLTNPPTSKIISSLADTEYTDSGLVPNTTYYWYIVAAEKNYCDTGAAGKFTTAATPGVPLLSAPTNGAGNQPVNSLTLSWSSAGGGPVTSYCLQVSTASDFSSTVYTGNQIANTSQTVGTMLLIGTAYFWRANASGPGGVSAWANTWSFTTISGQPILSSPANNATGVPIAALTLTWASENGMSVASYALQVSTDAAFGTTVYCGNNLSASSLVLSMTLAAGTSYFWRVNASGTGGVSAWANTWSFTTVQVPGVPNLSSPVNNAIGQPIARLTLSWTSGSGGPATSYGVQVSATSDFSSPVYAASQITNTSQAVGTTLSVGTTYFWRVNASGYGGISNWANAWSFTTAQAPGQPLFSSPANNAIGQPVTGLTLSWSSGSGGPVTSYGVQVSASSDFSSTVYAGNQITNTSQTLVATLFAGTTYFWRMNASGPGGTGTWTGTWSFATLMPAVLRQLPGGTFQMGSTNGNSDELPVHSVTVSPFHMDTTDVTQADYQSLMGVNPSYFTGNLQRPAESMTWFDAVLYCNARSKLYGYDTVYSFNSITPTGTAGNGCTNLGNLAMDFTKHGYRLPTEAEWEYACRSGSTADYYWGQSYPPLTTADTAKISAHAWWWINSSSGTQPVATKPPNAFGLYDMAGNVLQWCNDWYGSYASGSQTDPPGATSGSYRVLRGGSWGSYYVVYLRSANRLNLAPGSPYSDVGFRCVRR